MARPRDAKAEKKKKVKVTVSFYREVICRLDILAAMKALELGRKYDRSDLLQDIALPHLKSVVISIRGGPTGAEESAA